MELLYLIAQTGTAHANTFWDVVNQNMTAILGVILTIAGGIGAGCVGLGKLIWAISNSWIERLNKRADDEAEEESKERAKRIAVLDMTIESLPKHATAITDTCEILESLKDDHSIIHAAAIPALSAVICVAEKSAHDIPSDAIREMKEAHDILKIRDAARAQKRRDEIARRASSVQIASETFPGAAKQ